MQSNQNFIQTAQYVLQNMEMFERIKNAKPLNNFLTAMDRRLMVEKLTDAKYLILSEFYKDAEFEDFAWIHEVGSETTFFLKGEAVAVFTEKQDHQYLMGRLTINQIKNEI